MKIKASRIVALFLIIQLVLSVFAPVTVYANDATMLEPLIEPNTKTYKIDVVSDKPSWFASGTHYEGKYINFDYFYNSICGADFDDDLIGKLSDDPTICFRLDETIKSTDASKGVSSGYEFFLKAEGFSKSGTLISDDSEKQNVISAGKGNKNSKESYGGAKNDFLKSGKKNFKVLTFPPVHGYGAKNVTDAETEYAIEIGSLLSESLNSVLTAINGGKRYTSVTELVNKSILIRPTTVGYTIIDTDQEKDYIIVYGTKAKWGSYLSESSANPDSTSLKMEDKFSGETLKKAGYANIDDDGNLLGYIVPFESSKKYINSSGKEVSGDSALGYGVIENGDILWDEVSSFIWAVPKGYVKIGNVDNSLKFTDAEHGQYSFITDDKKDTPWITIHHLTMYANNAYKNHNIDISTKTSSTDSGNWIMALIVELFMNILNGLRTVLGLSDMYTLVYNKGARASASYNYGAMSDSWWTVVLRYHLIFQSLAWFLIICGFIKVLIDLNMSTINPQKKISTLETIQRFFVVGFLLVTIIPIIQFMLTMNSSIVKIFASQVDPNASTPPVIGSLAGLILQFAYFGIVVYVNFTYIMRSVIIGILTVTAPFFIASMGFSASNKGLFSNWFKELAANIFMQSVHAFSLAFLTNLVTSGGGLESLVVSYSMIPLTELVRNLIFGGAGSHASSLGMSAASKAINAGTGMVSSAGNMIAGKINDKLSKGDEEDGKSGSGSGSGNKGGGKGGESQTAQMNNGVTNKMNGIRENLKNQAEGKGGKSIAGNLKAGGASALKAAMNVGSALGGIMGMAVDMAGAEMSGTTTGYRSFGEKSTGVVRDAGKAVGNAGQAAQELGTAAEKTAVGGVKAAVGAAKGNAGQQGGSFKGFMTQNRDLKGGVYGASGTDGRLSVNTDPRTGANVSKFNSGGSTFSNTVDGGVNQTISGDSLNSLASGDGASAGFYSTVQTAIGNGPKAEVSAARQSLAKIGINVSAAGGGGAQITYSKDYMKNHGMTSMSASKNGSNVIVRTGQGMNVPNSFTPNYMTKTPHEQNSRNQVHDLGDENANPN